MTALEAVRVSTFGYNLNSETRRKTWVPPACGSARHRVRLATVPDDQPLALARLQAQLLRGEVAEKRALVAAVADARAKRGGAELTRAELSRMYARSIEAYTRQLVDVIEKQKFTIAGLARRAEKLELLLTRGEGGPLGGIETVGSRLRRWSLLLQAGSASVASPGRRAPPSLGQKVSSFTFETAEEPKRSIRSNIAAGGGAPAVMIFTVCSGFLITSSGAFTNMLKTIGAPPKCVTLWSVISG